MPSLSLLRRGSKQHDQQPLPEQQQQQRSPRSPRKDDGSRQAGAGIGIGIGAGVGAGTVGTGERERKPSKRDFFGGLLGRSKGRSATAASTATATGKSGHGAGAESPTKLPVSNLPCLTLCRFPRPLDPFFSFRFLERTPSCVFRSVVLFSTFEWPSVAVLSATPRQGPWSAVRVLSCWATRARVPRCSDAHSPGEGWR
ncbi:hypothetical protein CPLU01_02144 [Colletotrichum plurivorum]|uniref:Uncharacterized protein n=1 Tax=Colletotrichum plurivorum TaxID=2175906 RepID=A0A8H6KWC5_9PEZI|nr:hypothetical protein CPLU01_02144 [Colletotrichum plurivorum]